MHYLAHIYFSPILYTSSNCSLKLESNEKETKQVEKVEELLPPPSPKLLSPPCNDDIVEEIATSYEQSDPKEEDNSVQQMDVQDSQPNEQCPMQSHDMTLEEPFTELISAAMSNPEEEVKISPHEEEETACLEFIRDLCSPTVSYSLSSDQWAHRKEGLELIQKYIERNNKSLPDMPSNTIIEEFYAIAVILRKFFEDRVAPVYFAAYDTFRALLKVYGPYVEGPRVEDILRSLVMPLLISMGGEATGTNRRTQREACRCVLRVARLTHMDGLRLVLPLLTTEDVPLRPRLALLKLLMQEFRIEESSNGNCGSAISTELVMEICQCALSNADDKIRKAAVDNIGIAYGMVGKTIMMHISDVKPAVLKVLERKFSEVDGSEAPAGGGSPTVGGMKRKSRSKKNSLSRQGSSGVVGNEENIRNLAPVMLSKGSGSGLGNSFKEPARLLSQKSLSFAAATAGFGHGGMECEIYVKEKPKRLPAVVLPSTHSPQQNSPEESGHMEDSQPGGGGGLEGVSRQLFKQSDSAACAALSPVGGRTKGQHTPSKSGCTPGVSGQLQGQGKMDARFVISESIC